MTLAYMPPSECGERSTKGAGCQASRCSGLMGSIGVPCACAIRRLDDRLRMHSSAVRRVDGSICAHQAAIALSGQISQSRNSQDRPSSVTWHLL